MVISNKKGFTLIEVVVVGVLSLILAGAGFAIFFVFTNETKKAAANMKMQMQAEIVMETIARKAYEATFYRTDLITAPPDTVSIIDMVNLRGNSVYFYAPGKNHLPPFAGFEARNDGARWILYEYLPPLNTAGAPTAQGVSYMKPMTVGGDTVFLDRAGWPADGFPFTLGEDMGRPEMLRLDLAIRTISNNEAYSLKLGNVVTRSRLGVKQSSMGFYIDTK